MLFFKKKTERNAKNEHAYNQIGVNTDKCP